MGAAKFQKCSFSEHDFLQLMEYFFDRCDLEELNFFFLECLDVFGYEEMI
jgi:hypothetical protein